MITPAVCATMPALIRSRASELGDRIFFVCDEDRLSYAEADRQSQILAKGLLAAGARKGTRIGLLYPNNAAFAVAFLAVTRIGAVAVTYSTLATPDEIRWQLADSDTEILLGVSTYRSKDFSKGLGSSIEDLDFGQKPPLMSAQVPSLRHIFLPELPPEAAAWSIDRLPEMANGISDGFLKTAEDSVRAADRFVVVYTSGSTSTPKGVIHNQGALLEHLANLNKIRRMDTDMILFSNAPFFWIGGLAYAFIGVLVAGARIVGSISQSAATTLDTIEREKPTMAQGSPQSIAHLIKDPSYPNRDFSSVKRGNMPSVMAPEARPADPELRHNLLGSTETGSVWLLDDESIDLPESMRGSFGKPAPGFELKIVNPETKEELPKNELGEMWIRSPYMMEGYIGKERRDVFTPDGWYRTGDLAYVNDDGHVFFKGRHSDMIKTAGANVSPSEVEIVLAEITGQRVYVLGLEDPDRGQIVAAAIASDNFDCDEEALRAKLKEKVSAYKIPRRFLFLKEADIPMMSSGKLDKRKLVEMFRAS